MNRHRSLRRARSEPPKEEPQLLKPVRSVRLSDEVYDQLFSIISKGVLGPGEKLWPERHLSERFQVSRQSVREAINRAKILGLLEVRPGDGTYVRSLVPSSLTDPLIEVLHRETSRVLEFLQVRKVLEGWCAAEAAMKAGPADLRKLESCQKRLVKTSRRGGQLGKPDVEFHIAIAQATHNTVMAHLVNSLRSMFDAVLRVCLVVRDPARRQLIVPQHEEIYAAIRRRDPAGARAAMVSHLEFVDGEIRQFGDMNRPAAPTSRPGRSAPGPRAGSLRASRE
jgi:GntR family transcriptional repressor for pyruvate dehydrogenase complex